MPWDFAQPFTLHVAPQAGDIDGLNHTNNAVYVQWCERIGWAHSEALGLDLGDYHRLDRAMVIRQAHYDYLLPSLLGEPLVLGTWITASDGKLTMERRFQLVRASDGTTVMRGHWHLVCVELGNGKPRRMPEAFCRIYLAALTERAPSMAFTRWARAPCPASQR